jgi:hypothetical protein
MRENVVLEGHKVEEEHVEEPIPMVSTNSPGK